MPPTRCPPDQCQRTKNLIAFSLVVVVETTIDPIASPEADKMPYKLQSTGGGYKVVTKATGKAHSKKPLSKERAKAQMRAIYANTNEAFEVKLNAALGVVFEVTEQNPEQQ